MSDYESELARQDNNIRKQCEALYKGPKKHIGEFVVSRTIKKGSSLEICMSWHNALKQCLDNIKSNKSIMG